MESSMRCGQPFARHMRLCLYRCFGARGPVADNAWRAHGGCSYLASVCICQEILLDNSVRISKVCSV